MILPPMTHPAFKRLPRDHIAIGVSVPAFGNLRERIAS